MVIYSKTSGSRTTTRFFQVGGTGTLSDAVCSRIDFFRLETTVQRAFIQCKSTIQKGGDMVTNYATECFNLSKVRIVVQSVSRRQVLIKKKKNKKEKVNDSL
jgi:hypothetical protein